MTRKILVSPGYGAGWSSWASGDNMIECPEVTPVERTVIVYEKVE